LIIHFNTLIHPFTLADNRHYVFYVFRYSILFHPLIRYLLAPIYMLCFWLSYRTLSTPSSTIPTSSNAPSRSGTGRTEIQQKIQDRNRIAGVTQPDPGPTTSFFLIWLLTTALSLITAPLVEPRYFIIPWVMWRLHVPSWPSSHSSGAKKTKRGGLVEGLKSWTWKEYDYRLWIETAWFLVINAVTGYVFLYRGFAWVQEPGLVQRFMW
jgi:alpha-1,2-glucosyltransferase